MNYPRSMISFILTPKGPCVDGSTAPTKQIDYSVEDLQQGRYLVNFPYAYYRLTAVLMTALGGQNNCLHFYSIYIIIPDLYPGFPVAQFKNS